jgi:hypothetical protein
MAVAKLNKLQNIASFNDASTLQQICADQLRRGRLALVLGAGVSVGFGLPSWKSLIKRTFKIAKRSRRKDWSNEDAAEDLLANGASGDRVKLATMVRKALYEGYTFTTEELATNELLVALGALTMASGRGSVTRVVSFNYDDLLEAYLGHFGFVVRSVEKMPSWQSKADVTVYHPHGILTNDLSRKVERGVVITQKDFDEIVGNAADAWHNVILDIFRSNTCLFIGLSGEDANLTNLLFKTGKLHACEAVMWGIRFSTNKHDRKLTTWEERGVGQHTLSSYRELAPWLLEVCRLAASNNISVV